MSIGPRKMHVVVVAMARRGAAAKGSGRNSDKSAEWYCQVVVEGVISGVSGGCVVRWC